MKLMNISVKCFQKIFKTNFSTNSEVLVKVVNSCGVISLNRPNVLNALNLNMINIIYSTLLEWQKDSNINHVVIHSPGSKAFCAGGDIRKVTADAKSNFEESCKFFESEYKLNYLIATYGKPYLSILNGLFMGGGFGLSVHGKYRIISENSVFAMPETGIGLFPDVGGSYFLSRIPNYIGVYLGLTGLVLKGRDIFLCDVGTHFISTDKIANFTEKIINAKNNDEITYVLNAFDSSKQAKVLLSSIEKNHSFIREHFSKTTIQGIINSLSQNKSLNSLERYFCHESLETLNKMSPTSLKITIRQLNLGRHLTLKECLVMEYRISCRCLQNNDFHEGVRAVLIDKDNKPQWKPATLEEVSDEMIDQYFEPLPHDLVLE